MKEIRINVATGEITEIEVEDNGPILEIPPITEISFAQLIGGLVTEQWISKAEGKAWLRGTLPAPVETLISQLAESEQIFAEARAIRPTSVLLTDPLVQALAAMQGKTAELPAFFNKYGML